MSERILYKWPDGSIARKEIIHKGITIDVSYGTTQGLPGFSQVSIYGLKNYGGYLLGTPKNFSTKQQADSFVKKAKILLNKKQYGKKVGFMP